jgi:uncharacterized membrane protein
MRVRRATQKRPARHFDHSSRSDHTAPHNPAGANISTRKGRITMSEIQPTQANTGLAPNLAGALAYLFAPLTGILFMVIEKKNRFVRFHAAQSIVFGIACIVLWVALTILGLILGAIPLIGWILSMLLSFGFGLGCFALWLFLMFQALQGTEWAVPVMGAQARRLVPPAT